MKISFGLLVEKVKIGFKKLKKFDPLLLTSAFVLLVIGILAVYSATYTRTPSFYQKQIVFGILGIGLFFTFSNIDYRIYSKYSKLIYIFNVLFLISVFFLGSVRYGAQRWIVVGPINIQPSELAKLFLVLTFSDLLIRKYGESFRGFKDLFMTALHIVPIFLLVASQPDLGTGVVILFSYIVLIFMNGIDYKTFFTTGAIGFAMLPLVYFFALRPYQRQRVVTFMNPEADLLGSGWNIIQSKIAVGSGQIFGKGYLEGTQHTLRFLPESQTDFIFAVISEEFGFVGSALIILLYLVLIFTIIKIGQKADNRYGQLVCYGIAAIIFFHTLVNIGMVIGVMPAKGLPLLLLSYGGSSLMFICIMLGIVQSIKSYGNK